MPTFDASELNIVITILGAFILIYGIYSAKIKQSLYLGEALPATIVGIILGPIAAKLYKPEQWGAAAKDQQHYITLGLTRIVIGVQLVMAGYQLPARYPLTRWREMFLLLIPKMTIMWLCTTGCIILMVPKVTTLTAMVIASLVTSIDPVLSQSIAKGPFADKYVRRELREIISAEAASNDGFGFPFLLLATYLIRHAPQETLMFKSGAKDAKNGTAPLLMPRAVEGVGRLGGGAGEAVEVWIVEGWLYFIFTGVAAGAFIGTVSMFAVNFALKRKWIDNESLLLFPTALGLFVIGLTGSAGLDDPLACFCAGVALNWNGKFLAETLQRHDEVNNSIDVLLNFAGFMYIGAIMPWKDFNQPATTGVTPARLLALGLLVLILRRIPAMLALYKLMPGTIKNWKDALFMGYFGPIGIGAVLYVEHAVHLFPKPEEVETSEEENLLKVMGPVIYFLVLFSIIVHSLSIPALDVIYRWRGVEPIIEMDPVEERVLTISAPLPNNAHIDPKTGMMIRHNRFSRAVFLDGQHRVTFAVLGREHGKVLNEDDTPAFTPGRRPPPRPPTPNGVSRSVSKASTLVSEESIEDVKLKMQDRAWEEVPNNEKRVLEEHARF